MTATLPLPGRSALCAAPPLVRPARRWLHVVSHTDPRYGGLSSAVPALAATLDAREDLRTSLAAFCRPGERFYPPVVGADRISFWPAGRAAWWRHRQLGPAFAEALAPVDGVHIHGLWEASTAIACAAARKGGKPYVLSAHGMLEPWALGTKRLKKHLYAALVERANVTGASCLHALTAAEAEQYRRFGARGPVAVIPNAVTVPQHITAELFFEQYPALRGKRVFLFLSRLHPKKGLDLLVRSWARVCRDFPEAHLVIAGPDADGLEAALKRDCLARGIGSGVTFTGMLAGAHKWSALRAAECYLLPSYSEGLSMALLEAMGLGLPVIATRACNMPEITGTQAGWEIEATVDALTCTLQTALGHTPDENRARGRNGAQLIASRYTPPQVAGQMAAMYDFVLGGLRPPFVDVSSGGAR